jgi:hemerythrin-like domain-containing protein
MGNEPTNADEEAAISAPEDLMREHGVLNRILLIYEEGMRRLKQKEDVAPDVFRKPADLVRSFVEDYHEKLEEKFIFPRFEEKKKLVHLVTTLREQHLAGRRLTDVVLRFATPNEFGRADARQHVIRNCEAFIRMYRPHEAREDSELFPALYEVASADEVKELGEQFEEQEHKLFGRDGFKEAVEKVADIEKRLGIYDLASFTPK